MKTIESQVRIFSWIQYDCETAANVGKAPRCTGLTNSDFEKPYYLELLLDSLSGVFKKMVFGDRYALYSCNAKLILCFPNKCPKTSVLRG